MTIHGLDEDLIERLQRRADRHGRSVEEEASDILRCALDLTDKTETGGLGSAIHALFEPLGGVDLPEPERDPMRDPPPFKKYTKERQ